MANLDREAYVAMGRQAILELIDESHAIAVMELDARIADQRWPSVSHKIDPHHLTTARIQLLKTGATDVLSSAGRAGREHQLLVSTAPRRSTAIAKAAQRKRLLMSRYLGWAEGTPSRPGIIGPAAERVTHASLTSAAPYGYRLLRPDGTGVANMLGVHLSGALDSAAIFTALNDDGSPGASVAIPIEVKNVRDWLYPSSQEPYQLLSKAREIQQARPDLAVMPVLICRRAHYTLFRMAKDLGFFVVETQRQYVLPRMDENDVVELRTGLGFVDLVIKETQDELLVKRFTDTLPDYALDRAERWRHTTNSRFSIAFSELWKDGHARRRLRTLEAMRSLFHDEGLEGANGGW